MTPPRRLGWIALTLSFCLTQIPAPAQSATHLNLDDLRALPWPELHIQSATRITPDAQKHAHAAPYAKVDGVIGERIRFELLLPDNWNGRFCMGGGGGFVGSVQNEAEFSLQGGYATVGTDTGHEWQPGYSAGWAYTNLEAQVDFGYLAVHRTAEAAKALIHAYYSAEPAFSYFVGCSRGGGQAMMEAQRFPGDFDGIVAGAPAFNWPGLAALNVTIAQTLYPDPNHLVQTVLDRATLEKLQKAILDQCDAQDGLKDGVVQDPASAHFDLAQVPDLTDAQRHALEVIFHGASNAEGQIYPGYPPGAECDPDQWIAWIVGPVPAFAKEHAPDLLFAFGTEIFKYLVFDNPDWNYATYDFSHFASDTRTAASFLNATNPDLRALKERKGKLILWHGWADTALPPQATIDYYRQVLATDPNAPDYCRLFMVPGCLHCGGGPGASDVDWLAAIVDWVERHQSPDKLIASKSAAGQPQFTRPLYPYPTIALYKGSGPTNTADSFEPKSPR